ncbi:NAD(P)H-binding protein [Ornithinibacillus sp. L9]|uniref:NAD(P)H-binding protein n=1 Tax=Ornithinibacillus caprae TaxID=2678566 RepID=A0A6N8FJJ6_9BACI|nr:NAD-dependent epimerase/dehydratase family protein [Ornithinibacillus caprae]MUK89822.1 NAD(P)H-binding protein [Ornithinibacillus caprae]
MKKSLVLGATGGMGYSIVRELSARGMEVIAFARTKKRLHEMFDGDPNVVWKSGDVFNQYELEEIAQNVDIIYHAINIPYGDWKEKLIPLNQNIINTAKNASAKLAVVDNIYSYGRSNGKKITENTPKNPNTKKGKLRLEMINLIQQSGVPYFIAHFPDFYGPYAENAQINYTLRDIVNGKKARFIGKQDLLREHIYTPDGAKAIVELSLHEVAYGQSWNIPAYDVITGDEIIKLVRDVTGYNKPVGTVTKNMLRLVGLFDKQMREFVEMQYLNEEPVVLDGQKYEQFIGKVPKTPYQEGLKKTLEVYKV